MPFRAGQASITHFFESKGEDVVGAIAMTVRLRRPLRIRPGQYLYLFLSDMGLRRRIQAHPYVITWWDDSFSAMNLSFLIQPHNGISSELAARNSIQSVIIDGPYGKDLQLENYETVILIAKGIGIAGIIPYARHMTYRRTSKGKDHEAYRRGLLTRKLDLILTFSCFYPHKKTQPPPVTGDAHWTFIYEEEAIPIIEGLMTKQIQRSPGKTIITACGDAEFSSSIRSTVLKAMDEYQGVEFVETEFQPQDVPKVHPGIHSKIKEDTGDIEMDARSIARHVDRRRRAGQSQALATPKAGDRLRLMKSYSGVSAKLRTLEEVEESVDDGIQGAKPVSVKEIV
ncbi:uncharacterized protein BP5553_01145 [Venustampulla echinocandica]|uniref:FAD-binding FR-type domain-containing protein n=1 Tax=Venustampulla echinocandica TaxID=2656787 RepID=A0A370U062_9HELO|nr:uncharacterized protein BP5553_01145 [Venustampulla echinocandica]RDL41166.1 hypothetical protein BP5553_01145 [Venustampulla echinocandica]